MPFAQDPPEDQPAPGSDAGKPSAPEHVPSDARPRPEHTIPIAAAPRLAEGAPRQPKSNAPPPMDAAAAAVKAKPPKPAASTRPEAGPKTPAYEAPSPAALKAGSARPPKSSNRPPATMKGTGAPPRGLSKPPPPPSAAKPSTPSGGTGRPPLPSIRASAPPKAPAIPSRPSKAPPPIDASKKAKGSPPPPPPTDGDPVSVVEELSTADIADVGPFEEQAKELVAACEAELAVETDERKRARLHFEMARLFEGPLRDLRKAMTHYQEARKLAPEHVPTLEGARRVLLARKSYQSALELFDAELRTTAEPAYKAALLYEKGRILVDHLGRRDEAKECYLVALELAPNDASLLRALEQIHAEAHDHASIAAIIGREAQAIRADARLRSALLQKRARIHESRENDGEAAIGIYETALRLDPGSAPAIEALKRLHHKHRRFQDMAQLLLHEAEHAGDARVRVAALYGAARLNAEKLGNRDEGITLMERAASISGEDPLVLAALT
jgi:tetratricopeptide (TPR) repeat protein